MHSNSGLKLWKNTVAQRFGARFRYYNQHSDLQHNVAQSLAKDLPDLKQPDILEIGCGTGTLTHHLLQAYPDGRFYITDASQQMLEAAHLRFANKSALDWGVMDGEFPTTDRLYDLVISSMVAQWFGDVERGLQNLRGLLKPGGVLLYAIPAATSFKEWRSTLSDMDLHSGMISLPHPAGVFREEKHVIKYDNTFAFLKNMKQIGANTPRKNYMNLNAGQLRKACKKTDENYDGKITWHILYGRLTLS